MVVCEVQPQRDPRTKRGGRLELKAADLDYVNRLRRRIVDLGRERHADVAADEHSPAVGCNHPPEQCGCRRLSFRPGDRDDRTSQPARRQLHFADDFNATPPRGGEIRLVERDARARHDEIGGSRTWPAYGRRAPRRCRRLLRAARLVELRVAARSSPHGHPVDAAARLPRCRFGPLRPPPRAVPGPRSRHPPHHHRSFNVVRLKSAKITATIRNRVITFGSLHPSSSK